MEGKVLKIKIFNSEKTSEVEEEFEKFIQDKILIDIRYSSAGEGGFNRDCVCVLYKEI